MVIIKMKRRLIVSGAIIIFLIMLSTVTAVQQMHSTPVMNVLNKVEENRILIKNNVEKYVEKFEYNSLDIYRKGNISNLIDFLIRFLDFIIRISEFIFSILNLINWIYYIVNQLNNIISNILIARIICLYNGVIWQGI